MLENPMLFQIMYAVLVLGTLFTLAVTRNQVKSLLIGAAMAVVFMLSAGALHSMLEDKPTAAAPVVTSPAPVPSHTVTSPAPSK